MIFNLKTKTVFLIVSEPSADEETVDESSSPPAMTKATITTQVKYDRLWHQEMPHRISGYDISPSLSSSSNEDSTPIKTIQFTIVQTASTSSSSSSHLNDLIPNKQSSQPKHTSSENSALNRRICNDLRLSANKSFSEKVRPARPYFPPRRVDGCSVHDKQNSFENRLQTSNRLSEKRQSDPHIRYAFYNRGFEVATLTKHRKYSLSHCEIRRKAMPDIDEYDSIENDADSSDECSRQNLQYYSGSSGRDITLLPKLKIRICDEMGARIKHSFDESSFSDENFNIDADADDVACTYSSIPQCTIRNDPIENQPKCAHIKSNNDRIDDGNSSHSANDNVDKKQNPNIAGEIDNEIPICKKCGHRLIIRKQFTNAFV